MKPMVIAASWAAVALAVVGCSSTPAPPREGGVDDGGPSLPDPRLFDCTSIDADGGWAGRRASPVPVACGLDPACRTKQISGHRGAGGQLGVVAPEDTLSAYRAAIVMGIEYGETDPRPTADGVLVNVHDATVDRTTDGQGKVAEMTFAQVRALRPLAGEKRGDFS